MNLTYEAHQSDITREYSIKPSSAQLKAESHGVAFQL